MARSREENPPNDTLKCSLGNQIEKLSNFNTITTYNSLRARTKKKNARSSIEIKIHREHEKEKKKLIKSWFLLMPDAFNTSLMWWRKTWHLLLRFFFVRFQRFLVGKKRQWRKVKSGIKRNCRWSCGKNLLKTEKISWSVAWGLE